MISLIFATVSAIAAVAGGLLALGNRKNLNLTLGFTAGVLLGLVAFDLLPEIFHISEEVGLDVTYPMFGLIAGFLLFHIIERTILLHHSHEQRYAVHRHPHVGLASAAALIGHSFLDGLGIGLAFQVDSNIGLAVAAAVIGHRFADGFNGVNLMLFHKNNRRMTLRVLALVAIAPILGALASGFLALSEEYLVIYLGFFAGFLLYISAGDILPQAHSQGSSRKTILMTILGVAAIYLITRFIHIE